MLRGQRGALERFATSSARCLRPVPLNGSEEPSSCSLASATYASVPNEATPDTMRSKHSMIGLSVPPLCWERAWIQLALLARASFDVLREEVHVGVSNV